MEDVYPIHKPMQYFRSIRNRWVGGGGGGSVFVGGGSVFEILYQKMASLVKLR